MQVSPQSQRLLIELLDDKIHVIRTVLDYCEGDTVETEAKLLACEKALAELKGER